MPAYVIFVKERAIDDSRLEEYRSTARAARADHPMTLLAAGTPEAWEGDATDAVVVASFPTLEAARTWYDSPGYQAAKAIRLETGDYRVLMIEGPPA